MATIQEFKTEVQALVQQAMAQNLIKQDTVEDAMIWLIANLEAEDYFTMLRTKDMASLLIEGIKPIDQESVDTYLESQYDMIADEVTEEQQMVLWTLFTKRVENFLFP